METTPRHESKNAVSFTRRQQLGTEGPAVLADLIGTKPKGEEG
jgi:hypothetical protein